MHSELWGMDAQLNKTAELSLRNGAAELAVPIVLVPAQQCEPVDSSQIIMGVTLPTRFLMFFVLALRTVVVVAMISIGFEYLATMESFENLAGNIVTALLVVETEDIIFQFGR